jgi:hypothetical protein
MSPLAGFGRRRSAPLLNPDQGLDCKDSNSSRDLSVEKQYPFPIQNSQLVKSIRICRKIQKIAKPILLETRIQALQLWLIESGLKPNIFTVILEFR